MLAGTLAWVLCSCLWRSIGSIAIVRSSIVESESSTIRIRELSADARTSCRIGPGPCQPHHWALAVVMQHKVGTSNRERSGKIIWYAGGAHHQVLQLHKDTILAY